MSSDGSPSPVAAKPKAKKPAAASAGPKTVDMVVDAITTLNDRKGASIQAIKTFILEKHPTVDPNRLKSMLKRAIIKGMEAGVIIRPKASDASGTALTGRLKVDKAKLAALHKEKKPKKPLKTIAAKKVVKKATKVGRPKVEKSPKKTMAKTKKSPAAKAKAADKKPKETTPTATVSALPVSTPPVSQPPIKKEESPSQPNQDIQDPNISLNVDFEKKTAKSLTKASEKKSVKAKTVKQPPAKAAATKKQPKTPKKPKAPAKTRTIKK